jgi:myosin-5
MDPSFNSVGDDVYVRDDRFEWLPATILELNKESDSALVQIKIPSNWKLTTVLDGGASSRDTKTNDQRWVSLNDYFNDKLPLRGHQIVRDMADLPHLHEASILYQVKERHAQQKPYFRVGEIVVAVNPCQWIADLYSIENQRAYALNLVWQGKNKSVAKCIRKILGL